MSPRNRILLADFNETDIETSKGYLSELDCQIDVATDGVETLDCVAQFQPNLILLNRTMPTVSGFDICRQIKQNPATRKTMVLMVTQLNDVSDIERAVEAGADDFVCKPFNKSELQQRVENLLKLSRL